MITPKLPHPADGSPHRLSHPWQRCWRPSIFVLLLLTNAALPSAGCTGASTQTARDADTMIGKPPPPSEDPFFVQAMPADAIAVDSSGNIGIDIHNPAASRPSEVTPPAVTPPAVTPPEVARQEVARLETQIQRLEAEVAQLSDARAQAVQLQTQLKEAQRERSQLAERLEAAQRNVEAARLELKAAQQKQKAAQPEVATQPKPAVTQPASPSAASAPQCFSCVRICPSAGGCDERDEDVICGWGTHADAAQARQVARAQCDATLDLARKMPIWSRIDGQCPPATCR